MPLRCQGEVCTHFKRVLLVVRRLLWLSKGVSILPSIPHFYTIMYTALSCPVESVERPVPGRVHVQN